MKNEKLISVLKEFFKEAEGIWLFGSYADGTYNESSDIDIAVLFKDKKTPVEFFKMKENLEVLLKKDIDLVNLADVNDVFAYEIVTKGKIIKKSKYADDYEYRLWLRYLDLQNDKEIVKNYFTKTLLFSNGFATVTRNFKKISTVTLQMFSQSNVLYKIKSIERYIARIEEDYDEEFEKNYTKQDAVILNIQRAVQQAIDLGSYLIKKHKFGIPKSSKEIFEILEKHGVIDKNLSLNLQKMIGFRNIAIHEYTKLQHDIIKYIIDERLKDLVEYEKAVKSYESND
ncbi:type VII toxin-antitoxin system HepT family RNase toxin [Nautilia lithotrophica]